MNDMKAAWEKLNAQLQKNEQHSERLVKEMLQSKSQSALQKIINYDVMSIVVCFVSAMSLVILMLVFPQMLKMPMLHVSLIYWIAFSAVGVAFGITCIKKLYKVDFSKSLSQNIALVTRYKQLNQRAKLWIYMAIFIGLAATNIAISKFHLKPWFWAYNATILIVCAIVVIVSEKFYKRKLTAILSSMEELKEMEE